MSFPQCICAYVPYTLKLQKMVKCDLHCLDKIKKYIVNIKIIEIILFTLITKQGPHLTDEQVLCVKYCNH